jgi:uncharacterized protein YggT (Ycf19 family)
MVTAAKIIAWANIVVTILSVLFFVVIAIIAANSTPTDDFSSTGNAVMALLGT